MSDLMLLENYRNAYEARDWMGCDLIAKKVKPLTEKINKLRNELDEIKSGSAYFNGEAWAEIEKLKAENEKLRRAVEFYADKSNWKRGKNDGRMGIAAIDREIIFDKEDKGQIFGGKLARATLKEIDGE